MAQIAKALKKDLENLTVSSPTSTALLCDDVVWRGCMGGRIRHAWVNNGFFFGKIALCNKDFVEKRTRFIGKVKKCDKCLAILGG